MRSETAKFDPLKYKQTTRDQWDSTAEAWNRWGPALAQWLGPATEIMLDMAGVGPGSRVLDVAAGAGEQTITAARRVGPSGRVLATDISAGILEYAAAAARSAGLHNVQTRVLDAEEAGTLGGGGFDAAISRLGLFFFPDPPKALRGIHAALREGGKLGAVVFSTAEKNGFFSIPISIVRRRARHPPPLPGQPGPFSLGAAGVLEAAYGEAGFHDVAIRIVPSPLRLGSAAECVRFQRESFGVLRQMTSGLDAAEREETWREIERELRHFETSAGFEGACELVVAAGEKRL